MEVIDGIEMAAFALGALGLLMFVLFLGMRAAYRFAGLLGVAPAVLMCLVVVAVVAGDARRRKWSPVSMGLASAYALCLVALIVAEFFVS